MLDVEDELIAPPRCVTPLMDADNNVDMPAILLLVKRSFFNFFKLYFIFNGLLLKLLQRLLQCIPVSLCLNKSLNHYGLHNILFYRQYDLIFFVTKMNSAVVFRCMQNSTYRNFSYSALYIILQRFNAVSCMAA